VNILCYGHHSKPVSSKLLATNELLSKEMLSEAIKEANKEAIKSDSKKYGRE